MRRPLLTLGVVSILVSAALATAADEKPWSLRLRSRVEEGKGQYRVVEKAAAWEPKRTAIIVCDMWDLHHCLNAARRGAELAPTMDRVLKAARDRGAVIIHAPSDCMPSYADHPSRKRAMETPKAKSFPADIGTWCYKIPSEEKGTYPIDQSDGGEDDDPAEHAKWAEELAARGRNPKAPWKTETDLLTIDPARDYITADGREVWSILQHREVEHVILLGVHLNMCVLGRPFGLRRMAENGRDVVLMRDMTDTMYNPARAPYVSHFAGTELMVEHVEKFVCPTITSDQILGGQPFRFKGDAGPARADLGATARAIVAAHGAPIRAGLWVGPASGTPRFASEAGAAMPTASAIKTAILVELFARFAGRLDEAPADLDEILDDTHPAVAHFSPAQREEVRRALSEASVRRVGRVMMGSEPASNIVYNAAANVAIALLGGPEGATKAIRARDPASATIAVRRYMLADRRARGDNEATPEALAAVLGRLAARRVPGLDAGVVEEIRKAILAKDDPRRGRHYYKEGDLATPPITVVRSGWYEPAGGPAMVYVVMLAQDSAGLLSPDAAHDRLAATAAKLADALAR